MNVWWWMVEFGKDMACESKWYAIKFIKRNAVRLQFYLISITSYFFSYFKNSALSFSIHCSCFVVVIKTLFFIMIIMNSSGYETTTGEILQFNHATKTWTAVAAAIHKSPLNIITVERFGSKESIILWCYYNSIQIHQQCFAHTRVSEWERTTHSRLFFFFSCFISLTTAPPPKNTNNNRYRKNNKIEISAKIKSQKR